MSLESSTTCRIILSKLYWLWYIHWVFSGVWMEAEHWEIALNADTWSILVVWPLLIHSTGFCSLWNSLLFSIWCCLHVSIKQVSVLPAFRIGVTELAFIANTSTLSNLCLLYSASLFCDSFAVLIFEQQDCCFSMVIGLVILKLLPWCPVKAKKGQNSTKVL